MSKRILIIFIACVCFSLNIQAQFEHGLVFNGGTGSMDIELNPAIEGNMKYSDFKNKFNFSGGYRFRLIPSKTSFFYDIDVNVGVRLWKYDNSYEPTGEPNKWKANPGTDCTYIYTSLAGTVNYSLYKGFNVGLGIEPMYYIFQNGDKMSTPALDFPLLGKLSYNLRVIELAIVYRLGIFKSLKGENNIYDSCRFNDWQLSIFIPF